MIRKLWFQLMSKSIYFHISMHHVSNQVLRLFNHVQHESNNIQSTKQGSIHNQTETLVNLRCCSGFIHPLNVDFQCTSTKMFWQDLDIYIYEYIYIDILSLIRSGIPSLLVLFQDSHKLIAVHATINEQLEEVGDDYLSGNHCTCVNMLWDNESILTNWISCHMSLWQAVAATKQLYHWD